MFPAVGDTAAGGHGRHVQPAWPRGGSVRRHLGGCGHGLLECASWAAASILIKYLNPELACCLDKEYE